jgi:hypothetical protein
VFPGSGSGHADEARRRDPRRDHGLRRLADQETAVEYLVRKLPLDRRRATLRSREGGGVDLEVAAAEEADAGRIAEMLRRSDRQDD